MVEVQQRNTSFSHLSFRHQNSEALLGVGLRDARQLPVLNLFSFEIPPPSASLGNSCILSLITFSCFPKISYPIIRSRASFPSRRRDNNFSCVPFYARIIEFKMKPPGLLKTNLNALIIARRAVKFCEDRNLRHAIRKGLSCTAPNLYACRL
jgi:hypothetical protein